MTERDLAQMFTEFNACYFEGRLPHYEIRILPTIPGVSGTVSGRIEGQTISLRETDDPGTIESALLHEMAHAATGPEHGRLFFDELKRLQAEGAVLVGDDDVSEMTYEQFEANEDLKEAARRIRDEEAAEAQAETQKGERRQ